MTISQGMVVAIYVQSQTSLDFFGIHEYFQVIPHVGETLRVRRHDAEHFLTVLGVEHDVTPGGHSATLTCKRA